MKTCFITGISGQIGSYLAEQFIQQDYIVYGLCRSTSSLNNISHIRDKLYLYAADITDKKWIKELISDIKPDLFINTAAQSNIVQSFQNEQNTMEAAGNSVLDILGILGRFSYQTKFITLGSGMMFKSSSIPLTETSSFDNSNSPYAAAKIKAFDATIHARQQGLFASNVILFNTESARRSPEYISRKITQSAARISLNLQDKLHVGNINTRRNFLHAKDVSTAIFQIITSSTPDDFIVASDEQHSIQDIIELAFNKVQLNWKEYVVIDEKYIRPYEKDSQYIADNSKIKNILGWKPTISFEELIDEMMEHDLKLAKKKKRE